MWTENSLRVEAATKTPRHEGESLDSGAGGTETSQVIREGRGEGGHISHRPGHSTDNSEKSGILPEQVAFQWVPNRIGLCRVHSGAAPAWGNIASTCDNIARTQPDIATAFANIARPDSGAFPAHSVRPTIEPNIARTQSGTAPMEGNIATTCAGELPEGRAGAPRSGVTCYAEGRSWPQMNAENAKRRKDFALGPGGQLRTLCLLTQLPPLAQTSK